MTAQDLKDIYAKLGINTQELGCIMLEVEALKVSDIVPEDELYFSDNMHYAQGIVSEWGLPHLTLLWGLMQSGQDWKQYVDTLLEDVDLSSVKISEVDTFDNMDGDVPYSCYVAKIELTEGIVTANANLRKLPHIDSFPDYQPHVTLFYAKRNEEIKPQLLGELNDRFKGKDLNTQGINYGN